jgi:hypothetical protein
LKKITSVHGLRLSSDFFYLSPFRLLKMLGLLRREFSQSAKDLKRVDFH